MKRMCATLVLVSAAIFLVSCNYNGEANASPTSAVFADDPNKVELQIIQLERDWVAAIVNKDLAVLERILADDFVGTSIKGGVFCKTDAIDDIKNGVYVVQSMNMDEVSANVYDNTAVAFTSQDEQSTYLGKDSSGHFHFTNTWIKRDGKWQVVASHGSPYSR